MGAFDLITSKEEKTYKKILTESAKKNFIGDPFGNTDEELSADSKKLQEYKSKGEQIRANLGWVFAANDLIAESCASVPLVLKKRVSGKDDETIVAGKDYDAIFNLLDEPNVDLDGTSFRELYHSYMNLTGEFYAVKVDESDKLPLALHILPSQDCQYKIDSEGNRGVIWNGKWFGMDQIIRQIKPDPKDPHKGLSVVRATAQTIDADEQAKKYNRRFFSNSARPSTVLETEKVMSPEAFKRLKQQFEEFHVGTDNAHKALLLEGGAKARPYALTQKEMDFLESRKFNKDEILAMFKTSPGMLGMTENVNRSNMEAADYGFAKRVQIPRLRKFVAMLNKEIIKPFRADLYLDFESPVPEDGAQKLETVKAGVNVWMTINEAREMQGLKPIDGGEKLMIEAPVTPQANDDEEVVGDEDPPTDEAKKLSDFKKEMAKKFIQAGMVNLSKKKITPSHRRAIGEKRIANINRPLDEFERNFVIVTRKIFEEQNNALMLSLQREKSLNGSKKYNSKALEKTAMDLFGDAKWNIDLQDQLTPAYQAVMASSAQNANLLLPVQVGLLDDTPEWTSFIERRAKKIAEDINAETQKQIVAGLKDGLKAGENIDELRARIQVVMGDASSIRAERIARTESKRASSEADIQVWKNSSIVEGKEWYTQGSNPCPYCQSMDKKTLGLEESYFSKDSKHEVEILNTSGERKTLSRVYKYETIVAPPLHPSCRCILLPVIKKF